MSKRNSLPDSCFAYVDKSRNIRLLQFKDEFGQVDQELLQVAIANVDNIPVFSGNPATVKEKIKKQLLAFVPAVAPEVLEPDQNMLDLTRNVFHYQAHLMYCPHLTGDSGTVARETPNSKAQANFAYDATARKVYYLVTLDLENENETSTTLNIGDSKTMGEAVFTLPGGRVKQGEIDIDKDQESMLMAGYMYINVATSDYPDGEIRGQILPHRSSVKGGAPIPTEPGSTQPIMDPPMQPKVDPSSPDAMGTKEEKMMEEAEMAPPPEDRPDMEATMGPMMEEDAAVPLPQQQGTVDLEDMEDVPDEDREDDMADGGPGYKNKSNLDDSKNADLALELRLLDTPEKLRKFAVRQNQGQVDTPNLSVDTQPYETVLPKANSSTVDSVKSLIKNKQVKAQLIKTTKTSTKESHVLEIAMEGDSYPYHVYIEVHKGEDDKVQYVSLYESYLPPEAAADVLEFINTLGG